MSDHSQQQPPLNPEDTSLSGRLFSALSLRLELATIELSEERSRLMKLVGGTLAITFLLMMALILCTITVVVAFWESHLVTALIVTTVVYLVLSALMGLYLKNTLSGMKSLLSQTVAELRKDKACLFPKTQAYDNASKTY
jgi:uncharacterized membrane protein YqjE